MQPWAVAALSVATLALILAAAKAHGRQIRLERERHGVWTVDFRRDNDPWVEGLWKRDRRVFWIPLPAYLVGGAVVAMLIGFVRVPGWFVFVAAWAFAMCFVVAGFTSAWRLRAAMRGGVPSEEWRRRGHLGSLAWWSLVASLAAACAGLALWG